MGLVRKYGLDRSGSAQEGGRGGVSCLIATIKVTSDDEDKRKREKNKCTKTIVVNASSNSSNADSLSKFLENDLVGSILDEEESGKRT